MADEESAVVVDPAEPCAGCGVRRDEHADQGIVHRFSDLDITDHDYEAVSRG